MVYIKNCRKGPRQDLHPEPWGWHVNKGGGGGEYTNTAAPWPLCSNIGLTH